MPRRWEYLNSVAVSAILGPDSWASDHQNSSPLSKARANDSRQLSNASLSSSAVPGPLLATTDGSMIFAPRSTRGPSAGSDHDGIPGLENDGELPFRKTLVMEPSAVHANGQPGCHMKTDSASPSAASLSASRHSCAVAGVEASGGEWSGRTTPPPFFPVTHNVPS